MRRSFYLALLLLVCISSFISCKTEKGSITTPARLAKEFNPKSFEFENMTIKSRLTFTNGNKDQKVSAYIRMQKDSIIWMSISKTNVEGVRIVATQDTFLMLDRLNKQYYTYNYEQLKNKFNFPFDFKMFQSVLIGEIYYQGDLPTTAKKRGKFFVLQQMVNRLNVKNYIARSNQRLSSIDVKDPSGNKLNISYTDFQKVAEQDFAHKSESTLKYEREGKEQELSLAIKYSKIKIVEEKLSFPFKISKKFKKAE